MPDFLPSDLLQLFTPRAPIPYLPPVDTLSHEKKYTGYTPIGSYIQFFEDPKDTPPVISIITKEEIKEKRRQEKAEQVAYKLEQDIALWNPNNASGDPHKTLFVARINYDTSESKLKREFENYGPIKKINLVHDVKTNKPRGYAFIEYERTRDMRSAYRNANGKKIEGRRVLVDIERARTDKKFLPQRLGGGLGGTRRKRVDENVKDDKEKERVSDGDRQDKSDRNRDRERHRESTRRRDRSRSRDRERSRSRCTIRERSGKRDRSVSRNRRKRARDDRH